MEKQGRTEGAGDWVCVCVCTLGNRLHAQRYGAQHWGIVLINFDYFLSITRLVYSGLKIWRYEIDMKGRISNRPVFKWSGFNFSQPFENQTIQNVDIFKWRPFWATEIFVDFE